MGWNSWDCFGGSVTEAEVLANAEFMAEHLRPHGWDTVVVDIQWYEPEPGLTTYAERSTTEVDDHGRPLPAVNRFPSAADGRGFTARAERVHSMGLKFGVHLMRGVPRVAVEAGLPLQGSEFTCRDIADPGHRCPWNPDNEGVLTDHPGAAHWYDSLIALLAEWGVDFIKVDDVLYPPIERADIALISAAIAKTGRDIALSLSPGKQLSLAHLDFLREHAATWRVSDDLWDDWAAVLEQFQRAARWGPHQRPGAFGDLDMLPLGRLGIRAHVGEPRDSRLTLAEQRTVMTLWAIARSPLMFGGHLPETDPETIDLLSNDGVLAVNRASTDNRELRRDGNLVVWAARTGDAEVRAAFWLGDEPTALRLHAADLGVGPSVAATDLWTGEPIEITDGWLEVSLEPHGAGLLRLA